MGHTPSNGNESVPCIPLRKTCLNKSVIAIVVLLCGIPSLVPAHGSDNVLTP